jgi:hypothetical protein
LVNQYHISYSSPGAQAALGALKASYERQNKYEERKEFDELFEYITDHGKKNPRYTNRITGRWEGDSWTLDDVIAWKWNRHYNKEISSKDVSVSMANDGEMLWQKGSYKDLVELSLKVRYS